jgi:acetate kinase
MLDCLTFGPVPSSERDGARWKATKASAETRQRQRKATFGSEAFLCPFLVDQTLSAPACRSFEEGSGSAPMKILVLNCGSSSVKYKLFQLSAQSETNLAGGIVEEVGLGSPSLTHERPNGRTIRRANLSIRDHRQAIQMVLDILVDPQEGVLGDVHELDAVGQRVVHGGERFAESVQITSEVLQALYDNIPLAPLHNPPNIQGIEAVTALLPHAPQVAVFDTAFHQTMEPYAYLYAIPYRFYKQYGIRRYGFHGTSHKYVAQRAADYLRRPLRELRIVTCHLGNGASVTAVQEGRSVITSMGFTPLEGLAMGTRSGDLDPAIVPFLMKHEGLDFDGIDHVLNQESGVLGLSEMTSDMRVFEEAIRAGPEDPRYERSLLVIKHYTRRVKHYIGAYAAIMGGLDCVVFTGGIGENFAEVCDWSCQGLGFMGVEAVQARPAGGHIVEASSPRSPVRVLIVPTNEELAIARDTYELTHKSDR